MAAAPRFVAAELRQLVKGLSAIYAQGPGLPKTVTPDIVKAFGISTGLQPYDLSEALAYLYPVFSPVRNRTTRLHRQGRNFEFKAITNPDTSGASGEAQEFELAPAIATQTADVIAQFKSYGLSSDPVSYEQLYAGEGRAGDFGVDSRAVAVANLIKALFIKEERLVLFNHGATTQVTTQNNAPQNGLNWVVGGGLGNAPAPTVATGNTNTGGTLPASTPYDVVIAGVGTRAIVTGMSTVSNVIPFATGHAGESLPSAQVSITTGTGSNNYLLVTPPSYGGPVPILGWKVYVGTASGGPYYYAGFTTGATLQVNTAPSSSNQTPAAADDTAGTNAFNSFSSYIWATNSGATIYPVNGNLAVGNLRTFLGNMFANAYADPDSLYVSPQDSPTINDLAVGSGNPYYITLPEGSAQTDIIGDWRVNKWTNPVTGKVLAVRVHAYLPQGSIYALTEELPAWFVGNNVPSAHAIALSMDYLQIDYPPTQTTPQWVTGLRCYGAPISYLPSQDGVMTGITAPAA